VPVLLAVALGGWLGVSGHPIVAQAAGRITPPVDSSAAPPTEPVRFGVFAALDGLIVNPAGTGGQRYLMVSIGLEAARQGTLDELLSKEVVARDTALQLLGARTVEELADLHLREDLKDELLAAFNGLLRRGRIDRIYFTQFVLQ
jgi:flagellar protein FliL